MNTAAATVYLVTNVVNGKTYVGVTQCPVEQRWKGHVYAAATRARSHLHRSIRKHGADNFLVAPILSCFSVEAGKAGERALIRALAPAYNQTNGGEVTVGRRGGPELYAAIAAKNRGIKRTPEQVEVNRAQAARRYREDPEWRASILARLERGRANQDISKLRAAAGKSARERVWSVESRAKLSASCKAKYQDPSERAKTRRSQIGKVFSVETRAGMSAAAVLRASSLKGMAHVVAAGAVGACGRWNVSRNKPCVCGRHEQGGR